MKLDLKEHLIALATSREVKELVVSLLDHYAQSSETKVDDTLARAVHAALLE